MGFGPLASRPVITITSFKRIELRIGGRSYKKFYPQLSSKSSNIFRTILDCRSSIDVHFCASIYMIGFGSVWKSSIPVRLPSYSSSIGRCSLLRQTFGWLLRSNIKFKPIWKISFLKYVLRHPVHRSVTLIWRINHCNWIRTAIPKVNNGQRHSTKRRSVSMLIRTKDFVRSWRQYRSAIWRSSASSGM